MQCEGMQLKAPSTLFVQRDLTQPKSRYFRSGEEDFKNGYGGKLPPGCNHLAGAFAEVKPLTKTEFIGTNLSKKSRSSTQHYRGIRIGGFFNVGSPLCHQVHSPEC